MLPATASGISSTFALPGLPAARQRSLSPAVPCVEPSSWAALERLPGAKQVNVCLSRDSRFQD
jgi:hypothetical protein